MPYQLTMRKRSSSSKTPQRSSGAHLSSLVLFTTITIRIVIDDVKARAFHLFIVSYNNFHASIWFERSSGENGNQGNVGDGILPNISHANLDAELSPAFINNAEAKNYIE